MEITLNGESRTLPEGSSVADLLRALSLESKRIAVEVNRQIVRRERYAEVALSHGDAVEIVHFVGGG